MSCTEWRQDVQAFADAELSATRAEEFELHARGCPSCSEAVWNAVRLKQQVRRAGMRFLAGPALRARVQEQLAETSPRRRQRFWPALAFVAAALFFAGGLAFWYQARAVRIDLFLAGVVDRHITTLASAQPIDVVSSDRHTVKPWFQGKLPFSFNLPEVSGTQFSLAGGRMVYLDGEPGAHLIYNVGLHHVSVLIVADRGAPLPASGTQRDLRSFHLQTWSASGLRYFVVGDCAPADIRALAEMFQKTEIPTSAP